MNGWTELGWICVGVGITAGGALLARWFLNHTHKPAKKTPVWLAVSVAANEKIVRRWDVQVPRAADVVKVMLTEEPSGIVTGMTWSFQ